MGTQPDLDRSLREMLDDIPPHDESARRATLAAIPTTPQRRFRWLPPLFTGGTAGRRWAGASLAAGVSVLIVLGAVTLQPGDGGLLPGSQPGGITAPQPFEGRFLCGPTVHTSAMTSSDETIAGSDTRIREARAGAYRLTIDSMSDPRLQGELIDGLDSDAYGTAGGGLETGALVWTLTNDAGSWQTQFVNFTTGNSDWATATVPWSGSGDYDGLVAVMSLDYLPNATASDCGWDVRGYIVRAELIPPVPEPVT
jgi:hypothetical protein